MSNAAATMFRSMSGLAFKLKGKVVLNGAEKPITLESMVREPTSECYHGFHASELESRL